MIFIISNNNIQCLAGYLRQSKSVGDASHKPGMRSDETDLQLRTHCVILSFTTTERHFLQARVESTVPLTLASKFAGESYVVQ
jgi:hypothetical protein